MKLLRAHLIQAKYIFLFGGLFSIIPFGAVFAANKIEGPLADLAIAKGLGTVKSIPQAIGNLIGFALAFVGVIFFLLALHAGISWMTAAGNQDKYHKALKSLMTSIIGLGIVMASFVIVQFVFNAVDPNATTPSTNSANIASVNSGVCIPDPKGEQCASVNLSQCNANIKCELDATGKNCIFSTNVCIGLSNIQCKKAKGSCIWRSDAAFTQSSASANSANKPPVKVGCLFTGDIGLNPTRYNQSISDNDECYIFCLGRAARQNLTRGNTCAETVANSQGSSGVRSTCIYQNGSNTGKITVAATVLSNFLPSSINAGAITFSSNDASPFCNTYCAVSALRSNDKVTCTLGGDPVKKPSFPTLNQF